MPPERFRNLKKHKSLKKGGFYQIKLHTACTVNWALDI